MAVPMPALRGGNQLAGGLGDAFEAVHWSWRDPDHRPRGRFLRGALGGSRRRRRIRPYWPAESISGSGKRGPLVALPTPLMTYVIWAESA